MVRDDAEARPTRIVQFHQALCDARQLVDHIFRQQQTVLVAEVVQVSALHPGLPARLPSFVFVEDLNPTVGEKLSEVVGRKRLAIGGNAGLKVFIILLASHPGGNRRCPRPCLTR